MRRYVRVEADAFAACVNRVCQQNMRGGVNSILRYVRAEAEATLHPGLKLCVNRGVNNILWMDGGV